jgi:pterin-4a-carbinolamine dehydratase
MFLERKKANPELVLIPVLVNGAKMPEKHYLDDALSNICDLNALALNNTGKSIDFVELRTEIIKNRFVPVNLPPVETIRNLPAPEQLTPEEENNFLRRHPNWTISEIEKPGLSGDFFRELYCLYEFKSYDDAWHFIEQVNEKVIKVLNHHPRWQNTFHRVEFWLSTFNIGHKPSKRDLLFAEKVEKVWMKCRPHATTGFRQ